MPFSTSLLDNFNYATNTSRTLDQDSANWQSVSAMGGGTVPTSGTGGTAKVVEGGSPGFAGSTGGFSGQSSPWASTIGPDCEFYATLRNQASGASIGTNNIGWGLFARILNPGNASTFAAYMVFLSSSGGATPTFSIFLYKWAGSTATSMTTAQSVTGLLNSDTSSKLGIRVFNISGYPYVEGWVYSQTNAVWTRFISTFDKTSPLNSTGYPGIYLCKIDTSSPTNGGAAFDDFSGGTITAPTVTVLYPAAVIIPDRDNANAEAGPFRTVGTNGQLPVITQPALGNYPIFQQTNATGDVYGGGVSLY
jgi:hypothetical protein